MMAYEKHPDDTADLVSLVVSRIEDSRVVEVVQQVSIAVGDDSGAFRDRSLVMSGAALGVEEAQREAIAMVNTHARMLGDTLRNLELRIAEVEGDGPLVTFLTDLAAPIRDTVASAIRYNVQAMGDHMSLAYGIPRDLVEARGAPEEVLAALDATASVLQPTMYRGFMIVRPNASDAVRLRDLATVAATAAHLPQHYIKECIAKYGSLERTSNAFARLAGDDFSVFTNTGGVSSRQEPYEGRAGGAVTLRELRDAMFGVHNGRATRINYLPIREELLVPMDFRPAELRAIAAQVSMSMQQVVAGVEGSISYLTKYLQSTSPTFKAPVPPHPKAGEEVKKPRLVSRTVGGEKTKLVRQKDGAVRREAMEPQHNAETGDSINASN